MKKLLALPVLAVSAVLAAAPAHATHPYQECAIRVDVAAMARSLGGGASQAVVSYAFRWNMTPFGKADEPRDLVAIPGEGSAYARAVFSSLYERALDSVKIEFRKGAGDAEPAYTVVLKPLVDPDEAQAKGAPVVCRSGAD